MPYFSVSTGGFYHDDVHGAPRTRVPDPNWKRPTRKVMRPVLEAVPERKLVPHPQKVKDPDGKIVKIWVDDPDWKRPEVEVEEPDQDAEHPYIEIDNPDCRLPDDAVEVTEDEHRALMEAHAGGKVIVAGEDGRPVAADTPSPTTEALWASLRRERDDLLARSDWTQCDDSPLDVKVKAKWKTYRHALREITKQTDPAKIVWPKPPG